MHSKWHKPLPEFLNLLSKRPQNNLPIWKACWISASNTGPTEQCSRKTTPRRSVEWWSAVRRITKRLPFRRHQCSENAAFQKKSFNCIKEKYTWSFEEWIRLLFKKENTLKCWVPLSWYGSQLHTIKSWSKQENLNSTNHSISNLNN